MRVIGVDGIEKLLRPRIAPDKTVKQLMTELMASVLEFVEHFVGTTLATNLLEMGLHGLCLRCVFPAGDGSVGGTYAASREYDVNATFGDTARLDLLSGA
jgi:hypothetical protein